ncbi:hypothetical protein Riv7116_2860 [Rivularia sp. PCC 7116]|uniref:hypothetical protein n=1 Tax=Rivularia sp. PCC 7116 TaxID=373994 RepID=UPI00029F374E|nr:hypothetical protein [Rivularia sp. PCC 7116]AFY55357.1 hypothetical protein Riv7116_2860 [Rivularia sp. PCC 7116]
MLTKVFAGIAALMAIWSITDAYTQKSAFVLREEKQANFSPRRGTSASGYYNNRGTWIFYSSERSSYGGFRGGGPGTGK